MSFLNRFARGLLGLPYGIAVALLPVLVRVRVAQRPLTRGVLAVCHSGGPDPLFLARAVRAWRTPALFSVDPRYPWLRPLYRAFWRFEVRSGDREFNRRTLKEAVDHLRRGGRLMVFIDGPRFWEGRLKPGAALLARRAGVPLIPVGLENAYMYVPGAEGFSIPRLYIYVIGSLLRRRWVRVHFGDPIHPDPSLDEQGDVERMMRELAAALDAYSRRFVGSPGPFWEGPARGGGSPRP